MSTFIIYAMSVPSIIILCLVIVVFVVFGVLYISSTEVNEIRIQRYNVMDKKVKQVEFTDEIQGCKIAFFSDLHIGRTLKKEELKRKVRYLVDLDADLYIFGGDLIGSKIKNHYSYEDVRECFEPLREKKIIAVYGNHEYKSEEGITQEEKLSYFQAMNIQILCNESYQFVKDGKTITFYGLNESIYHTLPDTIPNCDFLISHTADNTLNYQNETIVLSGHTHGGQLRLPLIPLYYRPKNGHKFTTGLYRSNNKQIIVSNGLGCNMLKMRFCAPCDIIMIDYR